MRIGEFSLEYMDEQWTATVKNQLGDSLSGFGPTKGDALRNFAATLATSDIGERALAWDAFCAGASVDLRTTRVEAFREWWSQR